VRRLVLVATAPGVLMVPASPRILLRMLTPRRHQDPGYAARVAGELYGGSARKNPTVARGTCCTPRTRLGPARGYYYQLIAQLGWDQPAVAAKLRPPTLIPGRRRRPDHPLVNAADSCTRLIRRSKLHVYRGGHLELAADAARLASVVEAFLNADDPATERSSNDAGVQRAPRGIARDGLFLLRPRASSPTSSGRTSSRSRRFVDEEVVPVVGPYWERAEICLAAGQSGLPELGIVGEDIKGYGCAGMSPMACGSGHDGAAPRRRQPRRVPRRARGPGHGVDRDVRLGGAESALAS